MNVGAILYGRVQEGGKDGEVLGKLGSLIYARTLRLSSI